MYKVIQITWEEYRALNGVGVWTYWSGGNFADPSPQTTPDLVDWTREKSEGVLAEWLEEYPRKFFTRVKCDE